MWGARKQTWNGPELVQPVRRGRVLLRRRVRRCRTQAHPITCARASAADGAPEQPQCTSPGTRSTGSASAWEVPDEADVVLFPPGPDGSSASVHAYFGRGRRAPPPPPPSGGPLCGSWGGVFFRAPLRAAAATARGHVRGAPLGGSWGGMFSARRCAPPSPPPPPPAGAFGGPLGGCWGGYFFFSRRCAPPRPPPPGASGGLLVRHFFARAAARRRRHRPRARLRGTPGGLLGRHCLLRVAARRRRRRPRARLGGPWVAAGAVFYFARAAAHRRHRRPRAHLGSCWCGHYLGAPQRAAAASGRGHA